MAEEKRTENSTLFSLRELQKIEDDRVEHQKQSEMDRVAADRRAREDEQRRALEAEARARQDIEDRERATEMEKMRLSREGKIRVEESERRARVDAEARLREQQIAMEIKARQEGKKTWPWVLGAVVLVAAIGGGVLYKQQEAADLKQQALYEKLVSQEKEAERRFRETEEKALSQQRDLEKQLASAASDVDKAAAQARLATLREQREKEADQNRRRREANEKQAKSLNVKNKKFFGDDPLGGL